MCCNVILIIIALQMYYCSTVLFCTTDTSRVLYRSTKLVTKVPKYWDLWKMGIPAANPARGLLAGLEILLRIGTVL